MKKQSARSVDLVDKLTLPLFAVTMAAEYWALKSALKRTFGDLRDADERTFPAPSFPPTRSCLSDTSTATLLPVSPCSGQRGDRFRHSDRIRQVRSIPTGAF
jgi:hypothetical protein